MGRSCRADADDAGVEVARADVTPAGAVSVAAERAGAATAESDGRVLRMPSRIASVREASAAANAASWVASRTAAPASACAQRVRATSARADGSRPRVGSSTSSTLGVCAVCSTIARQRRSPADRSRGCCARRRANAGSEAPSPRSAANRAAVVPSVSRAPRGTPARRGRSAVRSSGRVRAVGAAPVGEAALGGDRVAQEQVVRCIGHQRDRAGGVHPVHGGRQGDQQCGLAGAVGPGQRDDLTGVEVQRGPIDRAPRATVHRHVGRSEHRQPSVGEERHDLTGQCGDQVVGRGRRAPPGIPDLTAVDHEHAIGDPGELCDAVLGDDDAHARLARQGAQQAPRSACGRRRPGRRGARPRAAGSAAR